MIHVAYRLWGGEGFYAKMCGTSMLSMFENTKEKVTVHIMHNDRLTPDNRGKLCYIAGQYNQHVEFHNVEEIAGPTLRKFEAAYPIKSGINSSWYPLIVHEVFPNFDKIIFLGADTVFNLDVGELWAYDLDERKNGEYGIGAVPEICNKLPEDYFRVILDGYVRHEDYFNVDVMLLKPYFFKEKLETILDGLKFVNKKRIESNYRHYAANEQDTLSYLFSKKYLKLPSKFNYIIKWRRMFEPKPLHLEPAIYHFADPSAKPSFDTNDIFNRLYFEYFLKTPWATADMFGTIDKFLQNNFIQNKQLLLQVTNLLAHRKRAFFAEKHTVDALKKIFEIKDDELIIDTSETNSVQRLLDEMTKSKDEKIFFLFVSNYWQLGTFLFIKNFVEGVNFVNAMMFLSERQGLKINFDTKLIVQAM